MSFAAVLRGLLMENLTTYPELVEIRKKAISVAEKNGLAPVDVALDIRDMLAEGYPVSTIVDLEFTYENDPQNPADG